MTTTPLSPAAQAVMDAFCPTSNLDRVALAAALRAVADQATPIQRIVGGGFRQHRSATAERLAIRRELLAIANELDPQP